MQPASYLPLFNEATFQRSNFLFLSLYQNRISFLNMRGLKESCPWVSSVQRKCRKVEASSEDAGSWKQQWGQDASVDAHPLPKSDPSAAAHTWQKSRIDFDSLPDLKLAFKSRATVLGNLTLGKQELRQSEKQNHFLLSLLFFFLFFLFFLFLMLNDRVIIPST